MNSIDRIARLDELVQKEMNGDPTSLQIARFDVDGGPVIGNGLIRTSEVAVMTAFLPEGVDFPMHNHDEAETIVCYRGVVIFTADSLDEPIRLRPGESHTFAPGVAHACTAEVDSCVVAISVPGSEDWPDGR